MFLKATPEVCYFLRVQAPMAVYKRTSRRMKRRSGDTDLDQLAYVKTRCAGLKTLQHKIEMFQRLTHRDLKLKEQRAQILLPQRHKGKLTVEKLLSAAAQCGDEKKRQRRKF
ncbi:PREDICTED: uncharacterized protein LOC107331834 [Acropora digitifera]|uniref:uncharacterized protein LOC107331834 n=1 Tax=Acropora digitifera TaxID=70779 RepID=UPI00077AB6AF|nr:PREDICTED: uncharacterized protein LOC107331834 [Acropora digitifera]